MLFKPPQLSVDYSKKETAFEVYVQILRITLDAELGE